MYSDVHSPLVATLQFNEKAADHDQLQSSDHTIDGRVKEWDNKKCLTFQDNVDKENLNGLYNELTNSISIGYSTIETKEVVRIGYNGFLFPHEYSGEGRGADMHLSYYQMFSWYVH